MTKPVAVKAVEASDPLAELLAAADARQDVLQLYDYDDPGRPAYIDKYPIESVRAVGIEEFIQQKFGGGKYWIRIRRKSGKYGPSAVVNVAGEPKSRSTAAATTDTAAVASTSPWEKILLTAVGAFAGAFAPVLAKKLLEGPPPAPDRVDELLKLANVIKAPAGSTDPVAQMTAMLAMMKSLREFQEDLSPDAGESRGGGGGGGMLSLLTDSVPRVLSILERKLADEGSMRRRLPAPGATGATAAASSTAASDANVEAPAADSSSDPLVTMLQRIPTPARSMLHQWAKMDLDPDFYADVVLDQFDEPTYAAMVEHLGREDFVDVLLATVPAYQSHREWFTKLVVAMRASVSGHTDAEGANQPGGSAGHGNTSSTPAKASA